MYYFLASISKKFPISKLKDARKELEKVKSENLVSQKNVPGNLMELVQSNFIVEGVLSIDIYIVMICGDKLYIYYRVHVQTYGWTDWKKNGETAGTAGQSLMAETIEIKLVKNNIDINHQLVQGDGKKHYTRHIDSPKTKSGIRKIPMSDDIYTLLWDFKVQTYAEIADSPYELDGYKCFVLHSASGAPLKHNVLNEYAKRIVSIYNSSHTDQLPHIHCHICRHTFLTRMAELNINPTALQKIAGHSSYMTTENLYISVEGGYVNEEFHRIMNDTCLTPNNN